MGVEEGTSNGDSTECSEGVGLLNGEIVDNGFEVGTETNIVEGSSGGSEGFQTYKRRKHMKSSLEIKLEEGGRAFAEAATQLVDQVCFSLSLCMHFACILILMGAWKECFRYTSSQFFILVCFFFIFVIIRRVAARGLILRFYGKISSEAF